MKTLLALALVFVAVMLFCAEKESEQQENRDKEWMTFSQIHHCKVTKSPTFGQPSTTWDCDGFQVVKHL